MENKHQFYLPSYEECLAITKANESFYEKQVEINGVKVSIFNYRIAQYKDFQRPIEGSSVTAFELRGLVFVHNEDGTHKRFLGLHKFFNLNQTENYQYEDVKDFLVSRTQDKCDGSMIRFLEIGGQLFSKTKMDFTNDQCKMAMACVKKQGLEGFIKKSLSNNLAAIWELVGPFNQIVLRYPNTELRLLQLRDELTGEYLDIYENSLVKEFNVKCSQREEVQLLHQYIERAKNEEEIEGWVLTLSNGQMIKIKTTWYCNLHGLLTENLVRENKIMELILTEKLDDSFGMIAVDDPRKTYSEAIQKAVVHYLDGQLKELLALVAQYSGNRKEYALANLKNPLFPLAVKLLEVENKEEKGYEKLKEKLQKETNRLMEAKDFILNVLKVELKDLGDRYDSEA